MSSAPCAEDGCRKQREAPESEGAKEWAERKRHRTRVKHVRLSSLLVSPSTSTSARCLPCASTCAPVSLSTGRQIRTRGVGVRLDGAARACLCALPHVSRDHGRPGSMCSLCPHRRLLMCALIPLWSRLEVLTLAPQIQPPCAGRGRDGPLRLESNTKCRLKKTKTDH
jgi:hypothetical protein